MAKSQAKLSARLMRRTGKSIKQIAKSLHVSKSSVSLWCQDIQLSPAQTLVLQKKMIELGAVGRMRGAQTNKQKRLDRIKFWEGEGVKKIGSITQRDLFMVGLGLYFGEGSKKQYFQFTNSSAALIEVVIKWLSLFSIKPEQLTARIFINEAHRDRLTIIEQHWQNITGIPKGNFTRPHFIAVAHKKQYENRTTYFGVLALRVYKSSELFYQILGLMKTFLYTVNTQKPA